VAVATATPSRLGLVATAQATPGAPLAYVAAGHGEVGLWDVANGNCLQVGWCRAGTGEGAGLGQRPRRRGPPPHPSTASRCTLLRSPCPQVLRTLTAAEAESGCVDVPSALRPPSSPPGQASASGRPLAGASQLVPGAAGSSGTAAAAAAAAEGPGNPGEGNDLAAAMRSGLCLQEVDMPQARWGPGCQHCAQIATRRGASCRSPWAPSPHANTTARLPAPLSPQAALHHSAAATGRRPAAGGRRRPRDPLLGAHMAGAQLCRCGPSVARRHHRAVVQHAAAACDAAALPRPRRRRRARRGGGHAARGGGAPGGRAALWTRGALRVEGGLLSLDCACVHHLLSGVFGSTPYTCCPPHTPLPPVTPADPARRCARPRQPHARAGRLPRRHNHSTAGFRGSARADAPERQQRRRDQVMEVAPSTRPSLHHYNL
jgi:hypothetical protein